MRKILVAIIIILIPAICFPMAKRPNSKEITPPKVSKEKQKDRGGTSKTHNKGNGATIKK